MFIDDNELLESVGEHNHEECEQMPRQPLSNSVKCKAMDGMYARTSTLVWSKVVDVHDEISSQLTKDIMLDAWKTVGRARKRVLSVLPKPRNEFVATESTIPVVTNLSHSYWWMILLIILYYLAVKLT